MQLEHLVCFPAVSCVGACDVAHVCRAAFRRPDSLFYPRVHIKSTPTVARVKVEIILEYGCLSSCLAIVYALVYCTVSFIEPVSLPVLSIQTCSTML